MVWCDIFISLLLTFLSLYLRTGTRVLFRDSHMSYQLFHYESTKLCLYYSKIFPLVVLHLHYTSDNPSPGSLSTWAHTLHCSALITIPCTFLSSFLCSCGLLCLKCPLTLLLSWIYISLSKLKANITSPEKPSLVIVRSSNSSSHHEPMGGHSALSKGISF